MRASTSLSGYDNNSRQTRQSTVQSTDGEPEGITDLTVTAVPQATIIDATAQVTPRVGQSPSTPRILWGIDPLRV
jgi:hypothetical protein